MKKKDVNRVDLGKNPFLNDFKIPIRRIGTTDFSEDGVPKYGHYDMELQSSCKIYIDKDFRKATIKHLKGGSAQLLLWICQKLEVGEDFIWIKRASCMKELDMKSSNTYRASIKSLCDNNILGAIYGVPDVFWINPKLYFKGQRHKVFVDHTEQWESDVYKLKVQNENREDI